MSTPTHPEAGRDKPDNVIDLFSRKPLSELAKAPFIRLSAELDGLEMRGSRAMDDRHRTLHRYRGPSGRPL